MVNIIPQNEDLSSIPAPRFPPLGFSSRLFLKPACPSFSLSVFPSLLPAPYFLLLPLFHFFLVPSVSILSFISSLCAPTIRSRFYSIFIFCSFPRPFFFNFLLFTLSLFFPVLRSFSHLYSFFFLVPFFPALYSSASRFSPLPCPFFLPPAFSSPFVLSLPLFRSFLVSGSFPARISSVLFPHRPVPQQSNPFRRPLLFCRLTTSIKKHELRKQT